MGEVQENLAHLPDDDLRAIAAYLKAVPPLPDAVPGKRRRRLSAQVRTPCRQCMWTSSPRPT